MILKPEPTEIRNQSTPPGLIGDLAANISHEGIRRKQIVIKEIASVLTRIPGISAARFWQDDKINHLNLMLLSWNPDKNNNNGQVRPAAAAARLISDPGPVEFMLPMPFKRSTNGSYSTQIFNLEPEAPQRLLGVVTAQPRNRIGVFVPGLETKSSAHVAQRALGMTENYLEGEPLPLSPLGYALTDILGFALTERMCNFWLNLERNPTRTSDAVWGNYQLTAASGPFTNKGKQTFIVSASTAGRILAD